MSAIGTVAPAFDVVRIGYRHGVPAAGLMQLPAGALMLISGPRSETLTLVPAWCNPTTAITPGQLAGVPTAWPVLLPADATTTAPAPLMSATASRYAAEHGSSPPR